MTNWLESVKHSQDNIMSCEQTFFPNGQLKSEAWIEDGQHHRLGGPARQEYYLTGQLMIQCWYKTGQIHRIGGPSFYSYYESGNSWSERWYRDGELHRVDPPGPAYQHWSSAWVSRNNWYIHGKEMNNVRRYVTRRGLIQ